MEFLDDFFCDIYELVSESKESIEKSNQTREYIQKADTSTFGLCGTISLL